MHPVTLRVRRFSLLAWLLVSAGAVQATVPVTAPDRWLAVEAATEGARGRLYQLARHAAPLCPENLRWGFGQIPHPISLRASTDSDSAARRQIAMQTFGAMPGEQTFVSVTAGTPWSRAGVQRGDILEAVISPDASEPSASPANELPRLFVLQPLARRLIEPANRRFAAQPAYTFRARREGKQFDVNVIAEPACDVMLDPIDSAHSYAAARGTGVLVTLPLLARLADEELTMVLAHEFAHVMLAKGEAGNAGATLASQVIFGGLLAPVTNTELAMMAPDDKSMIAADRLALWLLEPFRITPQSYHEFMRRIDGEGEFGFQPKYSRTRGLTPQRAKALEESVQLYAFQKKLYLPVGVAREGLEAFRVHAQTLRMPPTALPRDHTAPLLPRPAAAAAASSGVSPPLPAALRQAPIQLAPAASATPPASGFAAIDDVDKVPVRDEGKSRYLHFLGLPLPRAFIVTESGGWRMWWTKGNPTHDALKFCAAPSARCWLYAVDDRVVWHQEAGKRLSRPEQLTQREAHVGK